MGGTAILEAKGLVVRRGQRELVRLDSLALQPAELRVLLGPNGAGKTTLLKGISGLIKWEKDALKGTVGGKITIEGQVTFNGESLSVLPAHEIVKRGLVLTPERGRPFREMTVRENLEAGAYLYRNRAEIKENLETVYALFPVLKDRRRQMAGTISGGERTMLAIGRSLMSRAKLLLIDEPSVGLAPRVKEDMFRRVREVHGLGITILLTEQDIGFAFDLAARNYVISQGQVMAEGTPAELLENEIVRKSYLGM
jgi:branched-chain amino acid transport system ATP-binding protein